MSTFNTIKNGTLVADLTVTNILLITGLGIITDAGIACIPLASAAQAYQQGAQKIPMPAATTSFT
jgi:hypothetical protein